MRTVFALVLVSLGLAACGGSDNRPVVVQPPPSSTVVVPQTGQAATGCPNGAATC